MSRLKIRSVERGICPVARPTITELFLQLLWENALRMHEMAIFPTSGLKSDVTIMFVDPDFQ